MWILFTNWGRIGHGCGQYQNTPFGKAEQAVEEFEKIFKSKSGNEWCDRANFENKPKRYHLVKTEHLERVRKTAIEFDLKSDVPSRLPKEIQYLMKDVSNVAMYVNAYKEIGVDTAEVPFGRIKREVVEEAKKLLVKIKPLVKDKSAIEERRAKNNTEALQQQLFEVLDEISELSSEYFHLMPKNNFEYTALKPIDMEHEWEAEMRRVEHILEFETAERILLGAQYRKKEINPLDYIFQVKRKFLTYNVFLETDA